MNETSQPSAQNDEMIDSAIPEQITFHYIKSSQFRVIHVDGAYGGASPTGNYIEMAMFSERIPIPLQTVHQLTEDNGQLTEVSRVGRDGVTREVDVNAVLGLETAETIGNWLLDNVKKLKLLQNAGKQND